MPTTILDSTPTRLASPSGLRAELNLNGSLRRLDCEALTLSLFVGNEMEGGPTNLYLRRLTDKVEWTALLGPASPTRFHTDPATGRLIGVGSWQGINYTLALVLAKDKPAWFWHVQLHNSDPKPQQVDLTYVQDIALASYGGIRLNEFYVSQYLDHSPLQHPKQGGMLATRQNQAVDGRFPWSLIGSLREGKSFATDAKQFNGYASRTGAAPPGLTSDLPSRRLQHEHAMAVVRDAPITLDSNSTVHAGFFGLYVADHPDATSDSDIRRAAEALSLPESAPVTLPAGTTGTSSPDNTTLFSSAPLLPTTSLDAAELRRFFAPPWRHEETDDRGETLSLFQGDNSHVVLRTKEIHVQRPHGHLLRTGHHTTPDESALTSTTWMNGVFHSMLTQGHVSINRFLSTIHTYLGLFRSHGQRVFVEVDGQWNLLDLPSAYEMSPEACRWIYRHAAGIIQVRAQAHSDPHVLTLSLEVLSGPPARFLISHHVALNDDDGSAPGAAIWHREGEQIVLVPAPNTELGRRFPKGSFSITPAAGTRFQQVGGDELLFRDGRSRQQPFLCLVSEPVTNVALSIQGHLVPEEVDNPLPADPGTGLIPKLGMACANTGPMAERLGNLADIVPWYTHNAFVHYLSPRGLEQYSGGGWGTRDVCQGPVELLLALDRPQAIRDLLLRVMKQQNPDGDWPQWFMFFERERGIRPGDSHGDIVFWPLVVLAQYLVASGDAAVLDEPVRFFDSRSPDDGELATVWQHVQRAFGLIDKRVIAGTQLAAYGHGDWNDSLQPADPMLREHMCSAWTVTLHYQTLGLLARALRSIGRAEEAKPLESRAQQVLQDFQRLLLVEGVLAGYAVFDKGAVQRYLLHPSDKVTGIKYSALAMIHAIIEDMLTPAQAREHLQIIEKYLSGPDGVRLFDRPMPYHGGTQRIFQRAETATFFGREIGLMYTHAHLRYAQALAHVGDADRFFRALCQANPIGVRAIVPTATLRQANCYYSSSDAAFDDRYHASEEYGRIAQGTVALDGGWRVYSSGAGIALGLIVRRFLGLNYEANALRLDPVIPTALDGLRVETTLRGQPLEVRYRIGSAGCGVVEVSLNDKPLSFTLEANPHRRGAALVALPAVLEQLRAQQNVLSIRIG